MGSVAIEISSRNSLTNVAEGYRSPSLLAWLMVDRATGRLNLKEILQKKRGCFIRLLCEEFLHRAEVLSDPLVQEPVSEILLLVLYLVKKVDPVDKLVELQQY